MADNWRLTTPDLLSHLATLAYLNGGNEGAQLYNSYLVGRAGYEMLQRLKSNTQVTEADALRAKTIASIAEYIKKHPNASEKQLQGELSKQIESFIVKVAALEKQKA